MDNANFIDLTKSSYGTLCRTCLNNSDDLHEVFEVSYENDTLRDLLNKCTSIKIEEKDALPKQICGTCVIRLCDMHHFKILCLNSDSLLKQVLKFNIGVVKEENDLEFDADLITVEGEDLEQCTECPTPFTLSFSWKRLLIHTGIISQLCYSCGRSYTIKYRGITTKSMNDIDITPEVIAKTSFDQLCRTCLTKSNAMHQIFDISFNGIAVNKLLNSCTSIKVKKNDHLPQHMCEPCTAKLCIMYVFKKTCLKSQSFLKQAERSNTDDKFELVVVKVEPTSDLEGYLEKPDKLKSKRTCPVCNKSVAPQSFWRHKQLHNPNREPFTCARCSATFNLLCNLKRHIMTHTGERPHLCDYCGKSFIQAITLTEHKRTHTGEKPYKCRKCRKTWSQYSSYKSHMEKPSCSGRTKQGPNNYECNECCALFTSEGALRSHDCDNSPLECRICDRSFITRNALKIHIRTHNTPKDYVCTICDKKFSARMMFTRHMRRHRNYTQHICKECGKSFTNYSGLWSHRKTHTGEQPYACPVCHRSFSQAGSLKSHILIHTGEKPYTCGVCGRAFTQPNHLKYHLRTHSGEKPYTCKYCWKSFSLNGTLTVHMRIHTGETPFVCDICDKGFYDSSSMKKHRKRHFLIKNGIPLGVVKCENMLKVEV